LTEISSPCVAVVAFGLAFIDGHSDFRHLGNSEFVGSAAGEDLAIVTGRGDAGID
jgi:arginase